MRSQAMSGSNGAPTEEAETLFDGKISGMEIAKAVRRRLPASFHRLKAYAKGSNRSRSEIASSVGGSLAWTARSSGSDLCYWLKNVHVRLRRPAQRQSCSGFGPVGPGHVTLHFAHKFS